MKHPIANRAAGWLLLLILALAAFLRFWHIGQFPPGLFGDEAVNGLDALDVLAGRGAIFFPANFGREGGHIWLVAASLRLFGVTPFAVRLPSILAGILAVAAAAWLGHEVVSARGRGASARPLDAWLPLLVAAYTAASYWHLHFSRFGIRGIFTTLWTALAFAAFWRGVNTGRTRWFLLCGLCLGAGVYFYTASRFTPFALVIFLIVQAALAWRSRDRTVQSAPLLAAFFKPLLLAALTAALVVAPLGLYFLTHPGSFASRAATVSAFNADVAGASPLARIAQAGLANVAQFFIPGQGDPAAFYNLPGRAVFDPLTAILALLGLLLCLRRWRQPVYLFLALWPPLLLLPTFLAVDRFPTLPRALGVMPGIFIWAALGLQAVIESRFLPDFRFLRADFGFLKETRSVLALLAALLALSVHGGLAVRDYFYVWGPSAAAFEAFDGHETDSALWLTGHPQPAPVYLSADLYRHPVIMFLLEQTPLTEFFSHRNPGLHWLDARSGFVLPPAGAAATYVFSGQAQPPPAVLDAWLPQRQVIYARAAPDGQPATTVLQATAVETAGGPAAAIPFRNGLTLTGHTLSARPGPGVSVDITLAWQIESVPPARADSSYNVRVALLAADRPWAGVESLLPYRPAEWAAGERLITWHSLTLPPDAPAGAYTLAVALVDDAGQIVLLRSGAAEARLTLNP
ncbi:ArnT family glycosyltransferase [Candidatus Amarolinea aalborgensis]|uniref:ArnT family glycosyltransferase n=1 Tax=Candidatus Amarolinea aalborgensis TaxID=2249329 RepID=UPI003BF99A43